MQSCDLAENKIPSSESLLRDSGGFGVGFFNSPPGDEVFI